TPEALRLRGTVAVANSRLVYERFGEIFHGEAFAAARGRGARVQRPLWASTSTKNPAYPDTKYVTELIGPETVNTIPLATLEAFRDHGRVERTLDTDFDGARAVLDALPGLGIDLDAVTEQLQADGVTAFADAFDALLGALESRRRELGGA
ncbi:MAG TPA: transaldolase, partial [Acidobacteria bacterium]|nr:transaldolase [Acidobacteriota bacterium]